MSERMRVENYDGDIMECGGRLAVSVTLRGIWHA